MGISNDKPPIYLLDSMAFIFRAYHAMQRQRPMSTRTGIPTAATYVFVNMINKLRKDFNPQYLAAVYDVGAPVHRVQLADKLKDVKKFNIKTQEFETVEYGGYKANRTETPPDLIQQQPYIRRALEAFRIPILYYAGFEADDVIGTLSCSLSALGHKVFVVSSDKDMMQLVNEHVSILNPTKDNLILDAAGVEKTLGVAPERVHPEPDQGQPHPRPGGRGGRAWRTSGARDRRDGPARRCHRQYPWRAGYRR
jgi:DNA polymerase-1